MHFYKDDSNVYFVHIPRTGGRYVKELLLSNQFKNNFNGYHCFGTTRYKGIEIMHLTHELLMDFNTYKELKKFTIVRNPLNRFISAAKVELSLNSSPPFYWELNTVNNVLDYITYQQNAASYHNNWFKPQYEFVSNDCFFWKLENGFGENFQKFLLENLNIKLHNLNVNWKNPLDKKLKPINLDMEIVQQAISIAYKTDYDRFYRFPSG
jgi:hypothetical protein